MTQPASQACAHGPALRRQPPQPPHSDGELHLRWNSDGVILFAPDDAEDEASHEQEDALQEDGDGGEHPQLFLLRLLPVLRQRGARRMSAPHSCVRERPWGRRL